MGGSLPSSSCFALSLLAPVSTLLFQMHSPSIFFFSSKRKEKKTKKKKTIEKKEMQKKEGAFLQVFTLPSHFWLSLLPSHFYPFVSNAFS
jgi:hypothetical protein